MADEDVYLSNKHVILSSGGTKLNDLYYHGLNSSASLVECTYSMGKYSASLSNLSFDGTNNINIPNQSFLGETYLELELSNAADVGVGIPSDAVLCNAWGYAAIDSISYLMGSSNTSTITLSGPQIFMAVMSQCDTAEKRSEVLRLAGLTQIGPYTDGTRTRAYVLLPFPWSTMCDKLDVDTSLLSNNIMVTIKFKAANAIMTTAAGPLGSTYPTKFLNAKITFRQGDLSNTNLSLKHTMMQNPDLIYSYPLIHFSSGNSNNTTFKGSVDGGAPIQLNITGFLNSDLVGLYFYVVENNYVRGNLSPVTPAPRIITPVQPFRSDPITNVSLYFNGIPLYLTDGELYKLVNMVGTQNASFYSYTGVDPYTSPVGAAPKNDNSYICYIDFARLRAACYQNHFNNTFRVANQTLQLQFNTSKGSDVDYQCAYVMVYNGICEFRGGQSFIYFD